MTATQLAWGLKLDIKRVRCWWMRHSGVCSLPVFTLRVRFHGHVLIPNDISTPYDFLQLSVWLLRHFLATEMYVSLSNTITSQLTTSSLRAQPEVVLLWFQIKDPGFRIIILKFQLHIRYTLEGTVENVLTIGIPSLIFLCTGWFNKTLIEIRRQIVPYWNKIW